MNPVIVDGINELHYYELKEKVIEECELFKQKYKTILELRLQKPIERITIQECILQGFHSINLTRKHSQEILK